MQKPIRYGVISAGRMAGFTMLKIMNDHPAARPVAWYEIDPSRPDTAERVAKLEAAGLEACGSMEALLGREDVDAVVNVTPHYAHAETSVAALDAGKPVICEKPPAATVAGCEAMIAASERAGEPLMIHFQHLLRPTARWLNQALCAGELGRIRRVRCLSQWWRAPEYFRRVDWAGRREWDGKPCLDGAMMNQTVHYINQMLAFADRREESAVAAPGDVRAALYRFHDGDALEMEDTVVAAGTLANADETEFLFAGTTCAANAGGQTRGEEYAGLPDRHRIVIEGERGTAEWAGKATIRTDGEQVRTFEHEAPHWAFYTHARRVLRGEEPPVTPIAQAANTVRFVHAAYHAGGEIRPRDWARAGEVAAVLQRCFDALCLPEELDDRPAWASA